MSDTTMIKPPRIGVSAEGSAASRIVGPQRTDNRPVTAAKSITAPNLRRAGGSFGAPQGVQINRRGETPVTKLAPQTITILTSTLGNLLRFCAGPDGGARAAAAVAQVQAIVRAIANGESIADPPASPQVPQVPQAPQAPQIPGPPAETK